MYQDVLKISFPSIPNKTAISAMISQLTFFPPDKVSLETISSAKIQDNPIKSIALIPCILVGWVSLTSFPISVEFWLVFKL